MTRIARCRGAGSVPALRCQGRVLAQNRLLELVQGRARLDAELVDEQPPRLPIDLEGLGLPARAVEGAHELRAKPLAERMLADERLELPDELGVTAELEVGLDSALERGETELLEPADSACANDSPRGRRVPARARGREPREGAEPRARAATARASSTSRSKRSRSSSSGPTWIR